MKFNYINSSFRIFCGFYDSVLYNSDMLALGDTMEGYTFEFTEKGWYYYTQKACCAWVGHMRELLYENNPLNMYLHGFVKLHSPKEYNFTTDKIEMEVDVDLRHLKRWCFRDKRMDFDKYLRETWTSYDGFVSFVPNNVPAFKRAYGRGDKYEKANLRDIMVEFYLLECVDTDELYMDMTDKVPELLEGKILLEDEKTGKQYDYYWDDDKDMYMPVIPNEKQA